MYIKRVVEIISDKNFLKDSWVVPGALFGIATTVFTFIEFNDKTNKQHIFTFLMILSAIWILFNLIKSYRLSEIKLDIDGSEIEIKFGDIFSSPSNSFKVIAFNEFFDTIVDDKIIAKSSLNGQYINQIYPDAALLDSKIQKDERLRQKIVEKNVNRPLGGNTTRYGLGSVFVDSNFFLVAFSKFDKENKANLKLHEYAGCLINMWNEINVLYAQKEVIIPLLGSGITRHKDFDATPHQLLEVMLWTFKISKVKFKEPSKITILIHESYKKDITFYKLKEFEKNGL